MKTWMIVLLVVVAVYAIGAIGMGLYCKNVKLALFWPLTLLWMVFGNIQ